MICAFMWRSAEREFRAYLETMLDETLIAIAQGEDGAKSFCATRRSAGNIFQNLLISVRVQPNPCLAGVPFLVQAIVATEQATYPTKAAAGPNLARAVTSLFKVSKGESLDGRIHACNILRALFRDNRLGEAVGEFVEQGIVMAIKGFKSTNWAVRDILVIQ